MSGTGDLIAKIGVGLVLVQNALYFLQGQIDIGEYVFYIDILGFLLLGVGFIMMSRDSNDNNLMYGGLGVVGWVLARVYWQFVAISNFTIDTSADFTAIFDGIAALITELATFLLISSVLLAIGAFFFKKTARGGSTAFFIYALVNFITTFFFTAPFIGLFINENSIIALILGFWGKLIIVPILGVITFILMLTRFDRTA